MNLTRAQLGVTLVVLGCGGKPFVEKFPTDPAPAVSGPAWWGFGRDAQHTAIAERASQDLDRIVWRKRLDLAPPYQSDGELFIHYGSPVITGQNTVVLPIKLGGGGGFKIEARSGGNGALIWSADSDYRLPPAGGWTPSYDLSLSVAGKIYAPGAGGKLLVREAPDAGAGAVETAVFYGAAAYAASPTTYDSSVFINTPITIDPLGNAYFGFIVTGANPAGLTSGVARVDAGGSGTWISASAAAIDSTVGKVATNSAPAVSADGRTLYVAVNTLGDSQLMQPGYLLALDSETLAPRSRVLLDDPSTGGPANVSDNGTSSPTVGPDGDVYFGVLEVGLRHHDRGWLLHFDATLATSKVPGSFGWDDTPSIVPSAMVPSYTGASPYLIMSKYNNYGNPGLQGDGKNRVAILDPTASQSDPYADNVTVMKEILTIVGPTPDPEVRDGVKEWCINSAAVDPLSHSVLLNSEDGILYRWDLSTNQLSQSIRLTNGLGQAYTPTAIGADGAVYAIGNATLFVVGAMSP